MHAIMSINTVKREKSGLQVSEGGDKAAFSFSKERKDVFYDARDIRLGAGRKTGTNFIYSFSHAFLISFY